MSLFDKVGGFLKREAKDLGDAAESAKDKFDEELTKREEELKMTPSEKIAALQRQAFETDSKLDAIANKALGDQAAPPPPVSEAANLAPVAHVVATEPDTDAEMTDVLVPTAPEPAPAPPQPAAPVVPPPVSFIESPPASDFYQPPQSTEPAPLPPPGSEELPVRPPSPELPTRPASQELPTRDVSQELPPLSEPAALEPLTSAELASSASAEDVVHEPLAVAEVPKPTFEKTPAQLKYEEARGAANSLLEELRGELVDEGEI